MKKIVFTIIALMFSSFVALGTESEFKVQLSKEGNIEIKNSKGTNSLNINTGKFSFKEINNIIQEDSTNYDEYYELEKSYGFNLEETWHHVVANNSKRRFLAFNNGGYGRISTDIIDTTKKNIDRIPIFDVDDMVLEKNNLWMTDGYTEISLLKLDIQKEEMYVVRELKESNIIGYEKYKEKHIYAFSEGIMIFNELNKKMENISIKKRDLEKCYIKEDEIFRTFNFDLNSIYKSFSNVVLDGNYLYFAFVLNHEYHFIHTFFVKYNLDTKMYKIYIIDTLNGAKKLQKIEDRIWIFPEYYVSDDGGTYDYGGVGFYDIKTENIERLEMRTTEQNSSNDINGEISFQNHYNQFVERLILKNSKFYIYERKNEEESVKPEYQIDKFIDKDYIHILEDKAEEKDIISLNMLENRDKIFIPEEIKNKAVYFYMGKPVVIKKNGRGINFRDE